MAPKKNKQAKGKLAKEEALPSLPTNKLRSSLDIYNRLMWSGERNLASIFIGYLDRFTGIQEISVLEFQPGGEIPYHRIYYFREGKDRFWDRDKKIDKIFNSGNEYEEVVEVKASKHVIRDLSEHMEELPYFRFIDDSWKGETTSKSHLKIKNNLETLKIVSYNVLLEKQNEMLMSDIRNPEILNYLECLDADIIVLLEVTRDFLDLLKEQEWVREGYFLSDSRGETIRPYGQMILSTIRPNKLFVHEVKDSHKRIVCMEFIINNRKLRATCIHLPAGEDRASTRCGTIAFIAEHLGDPDEDVDNLWIGDFNISEIDERTQKALPAYMNDAWLVTNKNEPGFTYDPIKNDFAKILSKSGRSSRYDRMFFNNKCSFKPNYMTIGADEPFDSPVGPMFMSDHYSLFLEMDYDKVNQRDVLEDHNNNSSSIKEIDDSQDEEIQDYSVISEAVQNSNGFCEKETYELVASVSSNTFFAIANDRNNETTADFVCPLTSSQAKLLLEGKDEMDLSLVFPCKLEISSSVKKIDQIFEVTLESNSDAFLWSYECLNNIFSDSDTFDSRFTYRKTFCGEDLALNYQKQWMLVNCRPDSDLTFDAIGIRKIIDKTSHIVHWFPSALPEDNFDSQSKDIYNDDDQIILKLLSQEKTLLSCGEQSRRQAVFDELSLKCKLVISALTKLPLSDIEYVDILNTIGSVFLGVASPESDIDLFCYAPESIEPSTFFSVLKKYLDSSPLIVASRYVKDSFMPVLKVKFNCGLDADIQLCKIPLKDFISNVDFKEEILNLNSLDKSSRNSVNALLDGKFFLKNIPEKDLRAFRIALRFVKLWTARRNINGNAVGFLGGHSWTILLFQVFQNLQKERNIKNPTAIQLLTLFFRYHSTRDWYCNPSSCEKDIEYTSAAEICICCPTLPHNNSARNVCRTTLDLTLEELSRAAFIIENETSPWNNIITQHDFFKEFDLFLRFQLESPNPSSFDHHAGLVLSRFSKLLLKYEKLELTAWPNCKIFSMNSDLDSRKGYLFLGVYEDNQHISTIELLKNISNEFIKMFKESKSDGSLLTYKFVKNQKLEKFQ